MKKSLMLVLALTASAAALQVQADGDANAGSSKATVCFACHGPAGNSMVATYPKLAGQNASYIAEQLSNFKAGKRQNPIMQPQAQKLSDQDIQDLAAYFASQTVSTGEAAAGQVKQGESLYRN